MSDFVRRITSKDNFIIKRMRQLENRKYRAKYRQFIIEGSIALQEAIECGATIRFVLYGDEFLEETISKEFIYELLQMEIPVYSMDDGMFLSISDTTTPQGILAVIDRQEWDRNILNQPGSNLIVLDRLSDPGNVGTILRTAEAAGFGAVICLKGTAEPYSAKVSRAAAGALLRMPIFFFDTEEELVIQLRQAGKKILCTTPRSPFAYYRAKMNEDIAIIIGNEASGISSTLLSKANYLVGIPMAGKTESLNAGVAAAILMYESVRQKSSTKE